MRLFYFLLLFLSVLPSFGLRIRGRFNTGDFFGFIAKFGFQKTEQRNSNGTQVVKMKKYTF
jgi:hypothetical protein